MGETEGETGSCSDALLPRIDLFYFQKCPDLDDTLLL